MLFQSIVIDLNFTKIEALIQTHFSELIQIERKYRNFGVKLRLNINEFSSPRHLKDEIEISIEKVLFQPSTTITFKSIQLSKSIAENVEKRLVSIAQKNHCCIKTKFKHKYQSYPIPKASISNIQISKSIMAQSERFFSSSNVFKRMIIANGLIELHIGDIALQNVCIVTYNSLKSCKISD